MYERYSVREFCRKVEVKRRNTDGSYEYDWQDVEDLSGLKLLEGSVNSINYKISNNSYNFGIVTTNNVALKLNSKNGQFDDEANSGSVFAGFSRHKSLVRIKDGYVDYYTDAANPVEVYNTVFQGFIDATSASTKVNNENLLQNLQCVDMLSFLLKEYTLADMGILSSSTFETIIYEILNRAEFTDFFTVDTLNIAPGHNATSIVISEYEPQTQIFTILENISVGHSFFYVKDEVFYYQPITSGNVSTFVVDSKKLEKFSSFKNGISNVFEVFYWDKEPSVNFTASGNKYNKSQKINVDCVTNNTQRQSLIEAIGTIAKIERREFKISIPYFMEVFILDKITVESPSIIPDDAFIWGISRWGGESRWRRSLQADNIPNSVEWLVKDVKHSNFKTTLKLQEIV